jgi:hypothetical protein
MSSMRRKARRSNIDIEDSTRSSAWATSSHSCAPTDPALGRPWHKHSGGCARISGWMQRLPRRQQ